MELVFRALKTETKSHYHMTSTQQKIFIGKNSVFLLDGRMMKTNKEGF